MNSSATNIFQHIDHSESTNDCLLVKLVLVLEQQEYLQILSTDDYHRLTCKITHFNILKALAFIPGQSSSFVWNLHVFLEFAWFPSSATLNVSVMPIGGLA